MGESIFGYFWVFLGFANPTRERAGISSAQEDYRLPRRLGLRGLRAWPLTDHGDGHLISVMPSLNTPGYVQYGTAIGISQAGWPDKLDCK